MAYEKQTWVSYDDNKTEEQNINDGAVVTAERMNHIENGVEAQATKIELKNHLEDKENPHEVTAHQVGALTAEESSANVIDQVIGKESNIEATSLDFKDKVSGSLVENVNKIASTQYTSLLPPSNGAWLEFPQANIDKVKALDKDLFLRNEKTNGYMQQVLICYDVLAYLINRLGENFFTDQGANDVSSQVTVIRSMISGIAGNVWGYGSGPNGNKMTFQVWTHIRNKWEGPLTTTNSTVTKIQRPVGSTNDYIDSTGKVYFMVNAEPSDGVTASTLNIDYVSLQFDLNVSANDHIKSMMATYHEKNIGNVDNYGTATQAEAEAGSASDKFMTPLGTKQYVSSRVATQTETEGGTSSEKLMTPLRTKQHVDSRMADFSEISVGQSDDKIVSPKALREASIIPIKISEWMNIPLASTTEAADNTTPQYRIITFSSGENTCTKVELRGAVRSSSTHNIPSSNYSFNVSKLPSDIRPSQTVLVPCGTGHMSFTARGAVTPAGDLLLGNQSGVSFDYAYLDSLTYWLD